MENSYKYFKNTDCKYFPCHKGLSDDFNCLFCYCPMYSMPNCPGSKTYIEKNGKKLRYAQTVHFHTDRKIMIKSYRFWLGIIITDLWTLGSIFDSIFMEI